MAYTAITASTVLLGACSEPEPDAALADYVQRLERTLDQAPPEIKVPELPRLPPRSDLRLTLESSSLGTLDFLSLTGCAVQVTIGKRNSSLGIMASASQRLLLELEFLQLAPECIAFQRTQGEETLANLLQSAHQLKQEQLPALIFNATLASPEYRALWRPPEELGDYPANTSSEPLNALAAINASVSRWLSGDYSADNIAFEIQLSEVAQGDGGALLKALALQARWLHSADALLDMRREKGPLCQGLLRPAAVDTLGNVIRKYFVGEVQPWSAGLGRRQHELLPLLAELEQQLTAALPPTYQGWQAERDTQLLAWADAPRRHVQALQTTLEPCGGLTGRAASVKNATNPEK